MREVPNRGNWGFRARRNFANRGVFYCATCDGPAFAGKTVALAGGGDSGFTEALFLARIASKVIVVEALREPSACRVLQDRALGHPSIKVLCGARIETIRGTDRVECIDLLEPASGRKSVMEAEGVLVRVGLRPNTEYMKGALPLDRQGHILVDENMQTAIPGIFAAGDIRRGSPGQISTAVGDGATAAIHAEKYLLER